MPMRAPRASMCLLALVCSVLEAPLAIAAGDDGLTETQRKFRAEYKPNPYSSDAMTKTSEPKNRMTLAKKCAVTLVMVGGISLMPVGMLVGPPLANQSRTSQIPFQYSSPITDPRGWQNPGLTSSMKGTSEFVPGQEFNPPNFKNMALTRNLRPEEVDKLLNDYSRALMVRDIYEEAQRVLQELEQADADATTSGK